MKLELSKEEVERILMGWSTAKFPGEFNVIKIDVAYGFLRSATFDYVEPEPGEREES